MRGDGVRYRHDNIAGGDRGGEVVVVVGGVDLRASEGAGEGLMIEPLGLRPVVLLSKKQAKQLQRDGIAGIADKGRGVDDDRLRQLAVRHMGRAVFKPSLRDGVRQLSWLSLGHGGGAARKGTLRRGITPWHRPLGRGGTPTQDDA
jgi:hypothetical protein